MLSKILISLGVCCVTPIFIVWLVLNAKKNTINKKTEVAIKAIESSYDAKDKVDISKLFANATETIKLKLFTKLQYGIMFLLIGIAINIVVCINQMRNELYIVPGILIAVGLANIIAFFIGKKMLKREMELELEEKSKIK